MYVCSQQEPTTEHAGVQALKPCSTAACAAWSPVDPLDRYRRWTVIASLSLLGLAVLVALIYILVYLTTTKSDMCSGNRTWDVTMPFRHDHLLPPGETNYLCSGVKFPRDCTFYIQRVQPLDRGGHVAKYPSFSPTHHMILFASYQKFQTCPFTCYDMPETTGIVTSWALGGKDDVAPAGFATEVGGRSNVINGALQVHYDNPFHDEGIRFTDGGSGFRLHMTTKPPAKVFVRIMMGYGDPLKSQW